MNRRNLLLSASALLFLTACDGEKRVAGDDPLPKITSVTGAGSTAVAPLISRLATEMKKDGKLTINYQGGGSGSGVKALKEGTVDFAFTDYPPSDEDMSKYRWTQVSFVRIIVVPIVNVDCKVDMTKGDLSNIFQGNITDWTTVPGNDCVGPLIPVVRSDGSGTTYAWKGNLGLPASPAPFDINGAIGAKGNAGVAATVGQTKGSVGYVEYTYAKQNNLPMAKVEGWYGTPEAVRKGKYTIVGTTYLLIKEGVTHDVMWKFVKDTYDNYHNIIEELDYIPVEALGYGKQ